MSTGSADIFLILLVSGHVLGDFALQTEAMARSKRSPGVMLAHLAGVTAAHLIALAPLLTWTLVAVVLGVTASHGAVDLWKVRQARPRPGPLALFVLDQAAHLSILVLVWAVVVRWAGPPRSLLAAPMLDTFAGFTAIAAALAFNAMGGAAIVSGVLGEKDAEAKQDTPGGTGAGEAAAARTEPPTEGAVGVDARRGSTSSRRGSIGTGRLIGILERTLSLILILVGEWATIGILIAAKSIARFDELKERRFSEYYLIGTLTSLLVAIVTGLLLRTTLGWI